MFKFQYHCKYSVIQSVQKSTYLGSVGKVHGGAVISTDHEGKWNIRRTVSIVQKKKRIDED